MDHFSSAFSSNGYGSVANKIMNDEAAAFLKEKGAMAVGFARMKQLELMRFIDEGHWTWNVAGLVAGLIIMTTSFSGFLFHFFTLSWISAVGDVYLFVAGLIACILEFKHRVLTQYYVDVIKREALFLYRPYGRAAFYFLIGLLQIDVNGGLQGWLIGFYLSFTGAVIFYASQRSVQQLNVLKGNINNETELAEKFKTFDVDHSGYLEVGELASFSASMGAPMSKNDVEAAMLMLDSNSDGKIAFTELTEWWRGRSGENSI